MKSKESSLVASDERSSILDPRSSIPGELRVYLRQRLPDYMAPSAFVLLDTLPLTPNGKIDRAALGTTAPANVSEAAYVAPRTPIEKQLAQIWAEVLGVTQIGIHDNFFALGGHSLLAIQLGTRLRDMLQVEFPLRTIFEAPTIAELAERIQHARQHSPQAEEQMIAALPREAYRAKLSSLS